MRLRITLAFALLLLGVGTASAVTYLPLAMGTESHLQGVDDPANTLNLTVVENTGSQAVLYVDEVGGNDFDTWLRLDQDPDGKTYLLGQSFDGGASWNTTADPVVWIDMPLSVGHQWSQSTMLGTNTYEITSEVLAQEIVDVPAGQFTAICIQHVGVVAGAITYTYIEWYAEDIGIVKLDWTGFTHGDQYVLLDSTNVVATEGSSWDNLKAMYR